MRFAIKTAPQHTTWADMLDVWRAADDIDIFESAWNFDHFYPIFAGLARARASRAGRCWPRWPQATRRLRLGVLVTGIVVPAPGGARQHGGHGRHHLRRPARARHRCRLERGGVRPPTASPSATLTERFDRFDEACEVLISLLASTTTDFDGRYFQLADAYCEPKPVQQPHPPICIGGTGERRTLRSVARFAQHWNYPGGTIEMWQAKRDILHRHCADIGRNPSEILLSTHLRVSPEGDVGAVAEQAAQWADAGLDLGIITLPPPHRAGILEPLAQALRPLAT